MLFLNNPLLTSDDIIAAFEQLVLNEKPIAAPSYTVHSMIFLPENIKKYKNNYILIDPKLYYVKADGQQENSDLIIPESLSDYLQTAFRNPKNKTKTSKLTQLMVDEILVLNPSHSPHVLVQPPSALEQFQTKLKTLFFDSANPVEDLETDPRFKSSFHRLKQILTTIFALDAQSNLREALQKLKHSPLVDLDNPATNTQFELLDQSYGYFSSVNSEDKKEILKTVFSKLFLACQTMIRLFEKTNDANETLAYYYAYHLMALFLDPSEIKDIQQTFDDVARSTHKLFESYQGKGTQPLHDLLLVKLQLPVARELSDRQGWMRFIKKAGASSIDYLSWASQMEQKIAESTNEQGRRAPQNLSEAKKFLKLCTYTRAQEDPEFAELCYRYKVSEHRFNKCLDYIALGWPKKNSDTLPNVVIAGKDDAAGFYWVKLPVTDKRALILGDITHCCQSMGGESEACVREGVSFDNNGFYVLMRQHEGAEKSNLFINGEINDKNFDIVGQSYLWKSASGNLCFDSIECLSSVPVAVIKQMLQAFAMRALEDETIKRVNIGTGGKTPDELFARIFIAEKVMPGTTSYGDANEQYCIAQKPSKTYASLLTYSYEFRACATYLLDYVDNPEAFLKNLKRIPNITTDLTQKSLMMLLSLTKNPTIDDLTPIKSEALEKLSLEERNQTFKNYSLAKLMWSVGVIPGRESYPTGNAYEKAMELTGKKMAKILPFIPDESLEIITQTLGLFDRNSQAMSYFLNEDKRNIYERFKKIIPARINTLSDLIRIASNLSPDTCAELCLAIQNRLPGIIINAGKTTRDRQYPPDGLSNKQWEAIKKTLPLPNINDINSSGDFNTALHYYSDSAHGDEIYTMMQGRLPDLIHTGSDMTLVKQYLNETQRASVGDAVYRQLTSQSKLDHNLLYFLDDFTPAQATDICDNLVETLPPHTVKSFFRLLLKHLSPINRERFLQAQMDSLIPEIKTTEELRIVLQFLPNDESRAQFFKKMEPEFFRLSLTRCYEFDYIMETLTPEQQEIFYNKIQHKIPKLMTTLPSDKRQMRTEISYLFSHASPEICKKIGESIRSTLNHCLDEEWGVYGLLNPDGHSFTRDRMQFVFETLKNIFIPHIKTKDEYKAVAENLLPAQCIELYDALKDSIPQLKKPSLPGNIEEVSSAKDAKNFLSRFFRSNIQKTLYTQAKMRLLELVESEQDAYHILIYLGWDERIDFVKLIVHQKPHIVQSLQLVSILMDNNRNEAGHDQSILDSQEALFFLYGVIAPNLSDIIKNPRDLRVMLNAYPLYTLEILDKLQLKIPKLIKGPKDVSSTLTTYSKGISDGARAEIYNIIQNKLPDMIHDCNDISSVMHYLPLMQREDFCTKIDSKLRQLIHAINKPGLKKTEKSSQQYLLNDMRPLLPDLYQQEVDRALALYTLMNHLGRISSSAQGQSFATCLLDDDDQRLKSAFDNLITSIFKKRYIPRIFSEEITKSKFINNLSTLDRPWLNKINSALSLGLTEAQLASLNEVKTALDRYISSYYGPKISI